MDFTTLMAATAAIGIAGYKTGVWGGALSGAARMLEKCASYIADEDGRWGDLAGEIPLRDIWFDHGLMETRDGWFWTGIEVLPVPTDGMSWKEIQEVSVKLNRVITSLPENTRLQTLTLIDDGTSEVCAVHERKAGECPDPVWQTIERARAKYWRERAASGHVRRGRTWVLVGCQAKGKGTESLGLRSFWSASPWRDIERREVERVHDELMRLRHALMSNLHRAGGDARELPMRAVWGELWRRLNPELAEANEAPAYEEDLNPRKLLCTTPLHIRGWQLRFGDAASARLTATVSLQRPPVKTTPVVLQAFARQVSFPCVISTHALTVNALAKEEELEQRQKQAVVSINSAGVLPSLDEEEQLSERQELRRAAKRGEQTICRLGFGVTFEAEGEDQLLERRQTLLDLLRDCEGMAGVSESAVPHRQHLSTMPGFAVLDRRMFDVTSRPAAALLNLTGGSPGVPLEEALDVFEGVDGRAFGWHPGHDMTAKNGMQVIVGAPGSGKSALLGRHATAELAAGWQLLSFDYNGSSTRVALAAGAKVIRLGDSSCPQGLGLMSIWPEADENWSDEELTEDGLPRERLSQLLSMLSDLTSVGAKDDEMFDVLQRATIQTYRNACGCIPGVDDLIWTLSHWPRHAGREYARQLASRLRVCTREGAYGRFLNDTAPPLPVNTAFTCFDFLGTIEDERLSMIASMVAGTYVGRFLRVNRRQPKSFKVDEVQVFEELPRTQRVIDSTVRFARKCGVRTCTVTSQSARDFLHLPGVMDSCRIRWFLRSGNPEGVADVFKLSAGMRHALRRLGPGDSDHRQALLQTTRGAALLRLTNSDLDRRLLQGAASNDVVTMSAAKAATCLDVLPARLDAALHADALGQPTEAPQLREGNG